MGDNVSEKWKKKRCHLKDFPRMIVFETANHMIRKSLKTRKRLEEHQIKIQLFLIRCDLSCKGFNDIQLFISKTHRLMGNKIRIAVSTKYVLCKILQPL